MEEVVSGRCIGDDTSGRFFFVEVSVLLARNWRVGKVMQESVPSLWRCIQVTYSNRDVLKEEICRPM